jgi:hypothetical protein
VDDATRLFNEGRFFAAHELWEDEWRAETEPLRKQRLQGLAQLAAALVKLGQGSRRGAQRILERAAANLSAAGQGSDPWDTALALEQMPRWLDEPSQARLAFLTHQSG